MEARGVPLFLGQAGALPDVGGKRGSLVLFNGPSSVYYTPI